MTGTASGDLLIGRAHVVERIVAALAAGRDVVLHGPTGVGKSALARHVATAPDGDRGSVLWVQGTPGMSEVPLGAVLGALARDDAAGADARPAVLARRLLATVPAATRLCVVDDLQWVDDLTVGVLDQLRLVDGVRLVATIREGERLSAPALALGRAATRIEVGPLDDDAVAELVAARLGGPADPGLVARVGARAEGNPLFVTELLAGAGREGVLHEDRGVWRLKGDLVPSFVLDEVVAARLDGLPPEAATAAELLAVAEQMDVAHAERCVGEAALTDLEAGGLARIGERDGRTVVTLAHPIHAEVLRARLGQMGWRRHCRALARSLDPDADLEPADRLRLARWLLAADEPVPPDLAREAGRLALATFDIALGERLAQTAWRTRPTAAAGNLLAEVRHNQGDHAGAEEVLARVLELGADQRERAQAVSIHAMGVFHGSDDLPGAVELVRAARAEVDDPEARLALHTTELYLLLMGEAVDRLDDAIAAIEAEAPAHATGMTRLLVGSAHRLRGRVERALALFGTPAAGHERLFVRAEEVDGVTGATHALALLSYGQVEACEVVAGEIRRRGAEAGDARSRAQAASIMASAALGRGDAAAAEALAADAVATLDATSAPDLACLAHAMLVAAKALRGDVAGAAEPRRVLDGMVGAPERLYVLLRVRAQGLARALLDGEPAEAIATMLAEARRYVAVGAPVSASDLAHEALLLGAPADEVAGILAAAPFDGPLAAARLLHATALADGDGARLEEAGDRFAEMGWHRSARAALDGAAALARAAGSVRRARALAHRAAALAPQPDEGDGHRGADGPAAWAALTARERDIAALVARGLTSKAVAAELHLSPRTIDNNLQRIYAKLGIESRRQLAEQAAAAGLPAAVAPTTTAT